MEMYKILLVEDDLVDVITVERAFKRANIVNPLYKAEDGLVALDYLRGTNGKEKLVPPLILLLDIDLPHLNGLELLDIIKHDETLKSIPVVILTASYNTEDVAKAYENQVAGYLIKPVGMEKFVEKMAALGHYWSLCAMEGKE